VRGERGTNTDQPLRLLTCPFCCLTVFGMLLVKGQDSSRWATGEGGARRRRVEQGEGGLRHSHTGMLLLPLLLKCSCCEWIVGVLRVAVSGVCVVAGAADDGVD
jgi:hypothetical protein